MPNTCTSHANGYCPLIEKKSFSQNPFQVCIFGKLFFLDTQNLKLNSHVSKFKSLTLPKFENQVLRIWAATSTVNMLSNGTVLI